MSLVDRFICRREGHLPTITVFRSSWASATTYQTTCRRCGKWYEAHTVTSPYTSAAGGAA